jgi:hypothetical protein
MITENTAVKNRKAAASFCMRRLGNYMAGEEGFEPSHAGIKIRCLNQLGDSPTQLFINCLFRLIISEAAILS